METARALAYFVLLLGSAAAGEEDDSVLDCKNTLYSPMHRMTDDDVEECLETPEIAAVAEGFTGSDDDKRAEILQQCFAQRAGLFSGGDLDREEVKRRVTYYAENVATDEAAFQQALANCDSTLQQSYQLAAYFRCLIEYC